MPLELQIIRAAEFIRMGAKDHLDLEVSKAMLANLADACRKRGIDRALLDLREIQFGPKPVFSPADLLALVSTFRKVGFSRQLRLAILYQTDPHRRARLFAFASTLRGWNVRAFDSFENAISWLSSGEGGADNFIRKPAGKAITVRTSKSEPQSATLPVKLVKRPGKITGAGNPSAKVRRRNGRLG